MKSVFYILFREREEEAQKRTRHEYRKFTARIYYLLEALYLILCVDIH